MVFVDVGSGVHMNECAAHVVYTFATGHVDVEYPYEELCRIYPETASFLKSEDGVNLF